MQVIRLMFFTLLISLVLETINCSSFPTQNHVVFGSPPNSSVPNGEHDSPINKAYNVTGLGGSIIKGSGVQGTQIYDDTVRNSDVEMVGVEPTENGSNSVRVDVSTSDSNRSGIIASQAQELVEILPVGASDAITDDLTGDARMKSIETVPITSRLSEGESAAERNAKKGENLADQGLAQAPTVQNNRAQPDGVTEYKFEEIPVSTLPENVSSIASVGSGDQDTTPSVNVNDTHGEETTHHPDSCRSDKEMIRETEPFPLVAIKFLIAFCMGIVMTYNFKFIKRRIRSLCTPERMQVLFQNLGYP